jgi:hypothetical protein
MDFLAIAGEGLIRIDDQQDVERYGLPPTRVPRYPINSTLDALETSMGHELHCLVSLPYTKLVWIENHE